LGSPRGNKEQLRRQLGSAELPLVRTASQAVRDATGEDAVISACTGFTIAAILAQEGTPAVILGPGHIRDAHTVDESVAVEEIRAAARAYVALARRFLTP